MLVLRPMKSVQSTIHKIIFAFPSPFSDAISLQHLFDMQAGRLSPKSEAVFSFPFHQTVPQKKH